MNLFQWLTIPVITLLAIREIVQVFRTRRLSSVLRAFIWIAAAILILNPHTTSQIAQNVGIGRGADLVVYLFILTTTLVLFQFYGRLFQMRRDIVKLARQEALRTAVMGEGVSTSPENAPQTEHHGIDHE